MSRNDACQRPAASSRLGKRPNKSVGRQLGARLDYNSLSLPLHHAPEPHIKIVRSHREQGREEDRLNNKLFRINHAVLLLDDVPRMLLATPFGNRMPPLGTPISSPINYRQQVREMSTVNRLCIYC